MKKLILIAASCFTGIFASAQQGLENIIVEKYYVSDAKDATAKKGGFLPPGSVTYRIYVDMAYGYRFQAAYGVKGHELKIATTTSFFNNEESGAYVANDIPFANLKNNTVMLDSWLSTSGSSSASYGVMKSEDTSAVIVNAEGLLQNEDPHAGIPLRKKDGNYPGSPVYGVVVFGIDSAMLKMFKDQNSNEKGQTFSTSNGSWACFGGSIGLDSTNKVLIAQVTTDGDLSFELNLQIGKRGEHALNYVARNPVDKEMLFHGLIYPNSKETFGKKD